MAKRVLFPHTNSVTLLMFFPYTVIHHANLSGVQHEFRHLEVLEDKIYGVLHR